MTTTTTALLRLSRHQRQVPQRSGGRVAAGAQHSHQGSGRRAPLCASATGHEGLVRSPPGGTFVFYKGADTSSSRTRHSGIVRQDQTRNLEIPGSRCARPGMTAIVAGAFPSASTQSCIFEKSATARVAARISFSSFRRFSRTFGSSSFTITASKNASTAERKVESESMAVSKSSLLL